MTLRKIFFALGALFASNAIAQSPFSIYFNGESPTSNCHVDRVSNAQLSTSGSGNLVATAATPLEFSSACGISGTSQQLTFGPAQDLKLITTQPIAAGSSVAANFSVQPLNATACTAAISTTSGLGTVSPTNISVCTSQASCASLSTFSANFSNTGANSSTYSAQVSCTAVSGANPSTLQSSVVTLTQNGNSGGTPSASFTVATNGLMATFTDTSTDSGGTIGSWSWNFGDSSTSTTQNPSHTYAASGTYTVTLTVTDSVNSAHTSSSSQSVTVSGNTTYCTTGATGDVSYSPTSVPAAICSGNMTLYNPSKNVLGSSPYTFPFVFGSAWPGSYTGDAQVFTISGAQFLSIPFTPSPGHTIGITENQSYTSFPITFSISTSPGLFNKGAAGNGVLCAQTNNPTLQISSNGTTTNCSALSTGTQYWFNVIPAYYSTSQSKWVQTCSSSSCTLGISFSKIN